MNNPTIKDIAREAGVSIASVSRVLNNDGYTSEAMQKKVLKTADELNYYVNDIAKSLKTNKTNTIGVLIPDIANSFFMNIAKGLEDSIEETKFNLIFTSGMENIEKEKELLQLLIEKRVDGIVLATAGLHGDLMNNILTSNIPVVLVDRKIEGLSNVADCVIEDNFEGAYQLTKRLMKDGHKNIGVITGLLRVSTGLERFEGFKAHMKEDQLEINEEYIYEGDYSEEAGSRAVNYFAELPEPPSAILSLNNKMTVGATKKLMESYLSSRDRFTIASYGEIEFQNYLKNLKIYSVKQNPYKMGLKIGEIIMNRLFSEKTEKDSSEVVCLPPEYNFNI